jgi:RNA polymerase sigma-70 factor (ECF subfamily)
MFTLEQEVPAIISFSTASSRFSLEGIRATARANFKAIFEQHRHRVYSLAFWMTDNEMTAEEISGRTFLRAFRSSGEIDQKAIDSSLVSELREITSIGQITLNRPVMDQKSVAGNTKRVHLERAVVQVPATERLAFLMHDVDGYSHAQIAETLGITEVDSKRAVFQARLLVRDLVAEMR